MTTRLSNGQSFSNTKSGISYGEPAPAIYISHNKGDKSGDSLLTKDDRVFIDLGGSDRRLMPYDTLRDLVGHLSNLLSEYDGHLALAKQRAAEDKEQTYRAKLAEWEKTTCDQSINTVEAVKALMSGKTIRLLDNVLGDASGKGWEEYRLDSDGQVMCATYHRPKLHLASYGPLSKWAKDKLWVIVPFTARPQRG